jgi:APA family basic amino acid/polyamine antiporter
MIPKNFFGAVHNKFKTPYKTTILTGISVSILTGFLPLRILAELVSIGTLFAFTIVCAAVLIMRKTNPKAERPFKAPFYPFTPILGMLICILLMFSLPLENWWRLLLWLGIGIVIYFSYSRRHSIMNPDNQK